MGGAPGVEGDGPAVGALAGPGLPRYPRLKSPVTLFSSRLYPGHLPSFRFPFQPLHNPPLKVAAAAPNASPGPHRPAAAAARSRWPLSAPRGPRTPFRLRSHFPSHGDASKPLSLYFQ